MTESKRNWCIPLVSPSQTAIYVCEVSSQGADSGRFSSILSSEDLPHVDCVRIPEWQFEAQGWVQRLSNVWTDSPEHVNMPA